MNTIIEKPAVKTPSTRLLDLLYGWADFIDAEESAYPDTLTPDVLADLYQEAGAVFGQAYPDFESEQDAVCRFMTERVFPVLLQP